jgi:hypothetical protein
LGGKIRRIEILGILGKKYARLYLSGKKLGMMVHTHHPSDGGKCQVGE